MLGRVNFKNASRAKTSFYKYDDDDFVRLTIADRNSFQFVTISRHFRPFSAEKPSRNRQNYCLVFNSIFRSLSIIEPYQRKSTSHQRYLTDLLCCYLQVLTILHACSTKPVRFRSPFICRFYRRIVHNLVVFTNVVINAFVSFH